MIKKLLKIFSGILIAFITLICIPGFFSEGWPLAVILFVCNFFFFRFVFLRNRKQEQTTPQTNKTPKTKEAPQAESVKPKDTPIKDIIQKEVIEPDEIEDDTDISSELYTMVNGVSLIWQGATKIANIKIMGEINALSGLITRLTIKQNGDFYLDIADQNTGEITEVNETQITAIRVGSTKYDFVELCRKVLKLDLSELFNYSKLVRLEANKPQVIAKFAPIMATFTYESGSGTNRRTVAIDRYLKSHSGSEYISGICQLRKERRMFTSRHIKTMLATEGYKKCHFNIWLVEVAKIDPDLVG